MSDRQPQINNVMSIDVEEWFHPEAMRPFTPIERWPELPSHVERELEPLLELLDEARAKATFFILGPVARAHPRLVRRIAEAGHEVASHGNSHEMITDMDPETFRRDVSEARRILEDAGGRRVLGYRAPTFSVVRKTWWALDILKETGHAYDASVYPIHHDRYGVPDSPRFPYRHENGLAELPGTTIRTVGTNVPIGGGGYLRLLPLGFNVVAMSYLNSVEKRPFVVYLHPWETDPDLPRVTMPMPRRFRHYGRIEGMMDRLRFVMSRFRFTTARQVLADEGLLD